MNAYRRILVAVDGSSASNKGLREAVRLAKSEQAELCIFHMVNEYYAFAMPEGGAVLADLVPTLREGGKRILAKALAEAQKQGVRAKGATSFISCWTAQRMSTSTCPGAASYLSTN